MAEKPQRQQFRTYVEESTDMDIRKALKDILGLDSLPKGEDLAGFTEAQLKDAVAKCREIASYNKEIKNIDDLRSAVEAFEAVQTELTARADATAQADAAIAELDGRITVETDQDEDGDGDNGEGDGETPPAVVEVDSEKEPVTAATTPVVPTPTATSRPTVDSSPSVSLTAAGDIKGHSAGTNLQTMEVGEAFVAKANSIRMSKSNGQYPIGKVEWAYPDERTLSDRDSTSLNTEKINAVVASAQEQTRNNLRAILAAGNNYDELETLTAAGGLCAPVNVRYEIFTVGTTARPLRDSLTRFGATRGGIRFNAPPTLADLRDSDAVNIYTETQDQEGTDYPKGCIRVDCGDDVEVTVSAITLCMQVGNFQRLTFPENFNAWWQLGRVQHARIAEDAIWDRLDALSTNVSAGEGLGASVDTLAQVERAAAQYRDRHRIDPATPLRLRAPAFLRNIMRVDLTRRAPGDSTMNVTDSQVTQYFAARNIAVTWVLDGQFASGTSQYNQAAGALNPWPTSVDVNLSIDGTFLFLDLGSLDFGTEIRDFTMIRQNDVGAFMETFENVAFVGPEALMLTLNICPDGTTAGPDADFDPCTAGS